MTYQTYYRTTHVDNVEVFYREAGNAGNPVILLLHGFPSSSHQYRNLIPQLADKFHVIAPDLPGFGSTVVPAKGEFQYTFDALAEVIDGFIDALRLTRFAVYVFDYGAPVGFRLAVKHPDKIAAIISQNGNAYEAGLTEAWAPIRAYWENSSDDNRHALRASLTRQTTEWQYFEGTPESHKDRVSPDAINHDQAILDRDAEIQLDLFLDYKNNVAQYPIWQTYLREQQPPMLAVWGKNDPFFSAEGAEAFKKDVPNAQIELLDAGHFALETHGEEIAQYVHTFLEKVYRKEYAA